MVNSINHLGKWYDQAVAAQDAGQYEDALDIIDRILGQAPHMPQVHARKGEALWGLGRFEEALGSFDTVVSLAPRDPESHYGRGTSLQSLRRYEDAVLAYDRALAINPNHVRALHNRSLALGELGDIEKALNGYYRAIALAPDFVDFHMQKAMNLLLLGRWQEGWPEWEWRVRKFGPVGAMPAKGTLWRGEGLSGKTLLLQAEQGLGDTIQFCRYALVMRQMGANVLLQVQDTLARLLRSLDGVTIVPASAPAPDCDFRMMLMSTPGRLRTSLTGVPTFPAYIVPEPDLVEKWRRRLQSTKFSIGIFWQGGTLWGQTPGANSGRSFPLLNLAGIAALPNVRLVSLQKDSGVEQITSQTGGMKVETLSDDFDAGPDGFIDSAAVMKNLDLIITPDTAGAHLAGALGVPVWLALKKVPDWRWLLNRTDSVWYPSMRIFRQKTDGDWKAVFLEMERELRTLLDQKAE